MLGEDYVPGDFYTIKLGSLGLVICFKPIYQMNICDLIKIYFHTDFSALSSLQWTEQHYFVSEGQDLTWAKV